jgi:DNA-binding PadR family transcriptional regulator
MTRVRQTDIAVLGALSIEPMTGYRLRKEITETLGHFWHESFGQVYPSLARLEAEGCIVAMDGPKTSSRVFALTEAGQAELRRLLELPPEPQQPRNALLLRIFFGANLPPEAIADLLDDYEAQLREKLAGFAAIRRQLEADPLAGEHRRYWLATVSAGELAALSQVEWVTRTRTDLCGP